MNASTPQTPRHPQGEAPSTDTHGAARSLRPSPLGATARRALTLGEYVVCTAAGDPVIRTADPADAERFRSALNGRIKRRLVVTA